MNQKDMNRWMLKGAWLTGVGAWNAGRYAYGAAKHAEREREYEKQRQAYEAEKARLLAENTPLTGMATTDELENYRYRLDSLYLGRIHEDHGLDFEAGMPGDTHAFVFAMTGAGKGRTLLVQNCLRWPGPLFCIDPKGECAMHTAMRRGTIDKARRHGSKVTYVLDQKVAILDPFNIVRGPAGAAYRVTYNPLADIDLHRPDWSKRMDDIAGGLIIPAEGEEGHFTDNAKTILRGVIEALKTNEPIAAKQTLTMCSEILTWDYGRILDFLRRAPRTQANFTTRAVGLIEKVGPNELGSFTSTLLRNLDFLTEPALQKQTAHSDFSLWKAVQEGWSIYVCIDPTDLKKFKNWMRVLTRIALAAKVAQGAGQTGLQTLFALDEFPSMGRFEEIEESSGFMRDYGVKLMPIAPGITKLKTLYKDNWETFIESAGAVVAFGLNSQTTEQYLSERLGKVRVWESSIGASGGVSSQDAAMSMGGGNAGLSENLQQRERHIRMPNEIHEQAAPKTGRAFIIPAEGRPFMIRRQNYDDIGQPGLFDSREDIREWKDTRRERKI